MDVGVYVTELLQSIDEVTLSGIGTFYKKRTSAYFDNKQKIFFPPSVEYAFDPAKVTGGSELISYVCKVRNISEPSARYFTEKYIDGLKQTLQLKGYAPIDAIGKLRNTNNTYVFEPNAIEDKTSAYGLSPVFEIERRTGKTTEPDFSAIRFKAAQQPAEVKEAETAAAIPERKKSAEKNGIGAMWIVITFLALGAAIVAGYFLYPRIFGRKLESNPAVVSGGNTAKSPAAASKDSTQASQQEQKVNKEEAHGDTLMENGLEELRNEKGITIEKPRDTMEISTKAVPMAGNRNKDTAVVRSAASQTRYEIIAAAFHREAEAKSHIIDLRKKGIDAHIVTDTKKPKFKISLGTFTNEETANKERRRIQEKIAKDAWILIIRNK